MKLASGAKIAVGAIVLGMFGVAGSSLRWFADEAPAHVYSDGTSALVSRQVSALGASVGQKESIGSGGAGHLRVPASDSGRHEELSAQQKLQLAEYSRLRQQVLPKEDSVAESLRTFHDEKLLASLALFLVTAPSSAQTLELQNSAIDLLLEAREKVSSQASLSSLRAIIADSAIERSELSREAQVAIAGVKAEIMYRWLAQEPSRLEEIQRLLPGPVSRAIFRNVIAAQEQNRLESLGILAPIVARGAGAGGE